MSFCGEGFSFVLPSALAWRGSVDAELHRRCPDERHGRFALRIMRGLEHDSASHLNVSTWRGRNVAIRSHPKQSLNFNHR